MTAIGRDRGMDHGRRAALQPGPGLRVGLGRDPVRECSVAFPESPRAGRAAAVDGPRRPATGAIEHRGDDGEVAEVCLAIPGRIESIRDADGTPMARVDFAGVVREVCLALVPDAAVGDYAIVHVGFAIALVDEESARATLRTIADLGLLAEDDGIGGDGVPEPGGGP